MIKALLCGAAATAVLASAAAAAPRLEAPAWVVVPGTQSCRIELELAGASGAAVPASLVSNGDGVDLVFAKADAPERAFLPIRVDHKPFANLVLRQPDAKSASMQLSAESLAALTKGAVLQVSWLAQEPVQMGLTGSAQALSDLRVCGAQVAQRFRAEQAAEREARAQAEADARARQVTEEQLAAARAQKAAAEAEAERSAAEAERLRAAAEADRTRAQAEAQAARERAQEQARAESYPYARVRDYPDDARETDYAPYPYERYEPPVRYRRW